MAIKYALPGNKADQGTVARQTSINKVTAAPAQLIHNWNRTHNGANKKL